jgi:hypothetical protein
MALLGPCAKKDDQESTSPNDTNRILNLQSADTACSAADAVSVDAEFQLEFAGILSVLETGLADIEGISARDIDSHAEGALVARADTFTCRSLSYFCTIDSRENLD